eukprot:5936853-Heterocapsa_arctica.AAC.1
MQYGLVLSNANVKVLIRSVLFLSLVNLRTVNEFIKEMIVSRVMMDALFVPVVRSVLPPDSLMS